ncbi:MAG: NAD-dependent epimerase/dehydratase family protein, partial [Gemmatimonadaceae bacterium]
LQAMGVQCRVVDLTSASDVGRQFAGIGGGGDVYHLAAAYRTEHADLKEFRRVNVDATRNLLEAAKRSGVRRFVHCSTVGVQGQIDDPPATEEYRTEPGDHYQATKLEGELLAREYGAGGLPVTVVRPVGIYGPGDRRFLKLFRGIDRGQFVMIGSGKTLYHMTYIDDLIDGILLAASKAEGNGEVFTIGGPRYTTLWELVDLIADVLGKVHQRRRVPLAPVLAAAVVCERVCRVIGVNPPIYPRRVEFFSKDRAFDISKARAALGYAPRVDLPQGLAATAAWYRQRGWL